MRRSWCYIRDEVSAGHCVEQVLGIGDGVAF